MVFQSEEVMNSKYNISVSLSPMILHKLWDALFKHFYLIVPLDLTIPSLKLMDVFSVNWDIFLNNKCDVENYWHWTVHRAKPLILYPDLFLIAITAPSPLSF